MDEVCSREEFHHGLLSLTGGHFIGNNLGVNKCILMNHRHLNRASSLYGSSNLSLGSYPEVAPIAQLFETCKLGFFVVGCYPQ